jgi:hypothetical protein
VQPRSVAGVSAVLGMACLVGGTFVLAGGGWAIIAGGVCLLVLAVLLANGS